MRRHSRRAVAVLAGLAALLGGPGATAQPTTEAKGIGIRLVDAPVDRADDPRAQRYVIDHLAPGQNIQRRVEVANDSDATVTVALYAAAARVDDGRFVFGEDRAQNELTGWTSVTPSSLTIEPRGRAVATVAVAVGDRATGGEHYGVVWAEARAPEGSGITVAHRVGIRMYLSIGAGGEPPSDLEIKTLTAERDASGHPVVRADVANTGGRALDLAGTLQLFDGPGGLQAGPFNLEVGTTLAPGESAPATVLLDPELPDGPWRAVVTVSSGLIEKSAEATIEFPAGAAAAAEPVGVRSLDSEGTDLLRTGLAAAVGLVVLGGLGGLMTRRLRGASGARPRRPRPPREPARADRPRRRPSDSHPEASRRADEAQPAARARRPRAPRGRESEATSGRPLRRRARSR